MLSKEHQSTYIKSKALMFKWNACHTTTSGAVFVSEYLDAPISSVHSDTYYQSTINSKLEIAPFHVQPDIAKLSDIVGILTMFRILQFLESYLGLKDEVTVPIVFPAFIFLITCLIIVVMNLFITAIL